MDFKRNPLFQDYNPSRLRMQRKTPEEAKTQEDPGGQGTNPPGPDGTNTMKLD